MAELMDTLEALLDQQTGQISTRIGAILDHVLANRQFGQGAGGSSGGLGGMLDGLLGGTRDR